MSDTAGRIFVELAKGLALGGLSVALGMGFGVVAGIGAGLGFMAGVCAMFGGVVGLLTSPVFVWGVWHRPFLAGAGVALLTAVMCYAGGLLTPPNGGPFLAMLIGVVAYANLCIVAGIGTRAARRAGVRVACRVCGYSLQGLTQGVCPECGSRAPSDVAKAG